MRELVSAIFGDQAEPALPDAIHRNATGGQAVFLRKPSAALLASTLDRLKQPPDVAFEPQPPSTSGKGVFNYIHRQRDGRDIYCFGNSGDTPIDTVVTLRGRMQRLELWNPHDGSVSDVEGVRYRTVQGETVTEFRLAMPAVSSMALVGGAVSR